MLVSVLSKIAGIGMILAGLWLMLLVLGFAMLIGPGFEGAAWWAEYWDHIGSGGGWGPLGFGLLLVLVGGGLVVVPYDSKPKISSTDTRPNRDDFE